jgi:diketogulonate reductase-like aldo/keto reductase
MEKAVGAGKVRSIGLSNFYEKKFDEIMSIAAITPAVLQNEANPFFHQTEMKEYMRKYGTALMAWFPLGGRGNTQTLFNHETIAEIAKAHNKTSAQIVLRWHMQAGNIAIPGSSNPAHIQENIEIFDFALTDAEMQSIRLMDKGVGTFAYTTPESDEEIGQRFLSFSPDFNAQE